MLFVDSPPPPPPPVNFEDFNRQPGRGMFTGGVSAAGAGRISTRLSQMPAAPAEAYRGYDGTYQSAGYELQEGDEQMGGGDAPGDFLEKGQSCG